MCISLVVSFLFRFGICFDGGLRMWSRFDKLNVTTVDAFSQNDTTNEIERISTIAGSLASIGTERTETLVQQNLSPF